ncbi:tRNA 2-selenouridine(34) synthase MnmH [Maritimibacter sp. 55A14]|uniref:tRNA 2-selenouridine(34) synthase MnmH n=1 Tax=Maritimibacter sp. 55A14 TaxID=2174844 RepID=UPI000D620191|nr:tRNA 2-selenouridine(34) synthase MnmH [Maritimibacter sp. 55A14]PWE32884.1 tRNA 2-selenouridine(34) synthase MnmH [Maritimibacter sp. 55A14]
MAVTLSSLDDLDRLEADEIIDVRSPAEFAEDHLPGAVNLPVLSDAERARVGTIYVQQDAFLARKIGAALVARNAAAHIEGPLASRDGGWRPLVYCWRGGQRSGSFASILAQIGWRVQLLEGGYRSYRRLVKAALYDARFPVPVILLDGNTGTAKTELLHLLAARGLQVIDLEGLANHRGSLFGPRPGGQPGQKAFESALAAAMRQLDPGRAVVIEAESSKVGERILPPALWSAMKAAPRVTLSAPLEARARYLARAYADMTADPERLCATIAMLRRLHGADVTERWQALARAGDFTGLAAELMKLHYDPRYARQRARTGDTGGAAVALGDLSAEGLARGADRLAHEIRALGG